MNVSELRDILKDMPPTLPVHVMEVVDGATLSRDINLVFESQPYDGERVWVILSEEFNRPRWMR